MASLIDGYLYAGVSGLRQVQVSEDGVTYVTLLLTTSMTVTDALAEWESQANASGTLSGTYDFTASNGSVTFERTDPGNFWLTLDGSLPAALGFSTASWSGSDTYTSDGTPKAVVWPLGVSYEAPKPAGESQRVVRRWGRAQVFTHNRAKVTQIRVFLDSSTADDLLSGPLFTARCKVSPVEGTPAYDITQLDGFLDCYPSGDLDVERVGVADAHTVVTFAATLDETVHA